MVKKFDDSYNRFDSVPTYTQKDGRMDWGQTEMVINIAVSAC